MEYTLLRQHYHMFTCRMNTEPGEVTLRVLSPYTPTYLMDAQMQLLSGLIFRTLQHDSREQLSGQLQCSPCSEMLLPSARVINTSDSTHNDIPLWT